MSLNNTQQYVQLHNYRTHFINTIDNVLKGQVHKTASFKGQHGEQCLHPASVESVQVLCCSLYLLIKAPASMLEELDVVRE